MALLAVNERRLLVSLPVLIIEVKIFLLIQEVAAAITFACSLTAAKSSFYPLALVVGVLHIFDVDINISSNN